MSSLGRNIGSSIAGTVAVTGLTLVITPVLIRVLGMEAYGIIGFIATLQAAFTAFDFGLSSTLTREIAADATGGRTASDELIGTAVTVYWAVALVIGTALYLAAGPIARDWFNTVALAPGDLARSLGVIAIYVALRWPVALYVGVLTGLQRLDVLNALKVATTALRLLGGIAVVLAYRSLQSYLVWTVMSAIIEVVVYDIAVRRIHPSFPVLPGFSGPAVRRVWRFSLSMNALAVLAVVIVQLDRLTVSKLLTLDALGRYNLAYTGASLITLIVAAVSSALLPSFASAHGRGETADLARRYRDADHVMLFLVGLVAFAMVANGEALLSLWVGHAAAAGTGLPLSILAVGFWLSAVIANVYNVAIARGAPGVFLRANVIGIVPYGLLLYVLTVTYGTAATAACWALLNLYYALVLVPTVHRRMIGISTLAWLGRVIVPCFATGVAAFFVPKMITAYFGMAPTLVNVAILLAVSGLLYVGLFVAILGGPAGVGGLLAAMRHRTTV